MSDLKTSQTVAAELRCQVVDAERKLHEEKVPSPSLPLLLFLFNPFRIFGNAFSQGASVMLERKERAWEREMAALVEEKEELAAELKHQKEPRRSIGWSPKASGPFLLLSPREEFKSSLEQIYRAYRDVGYQAGLKDGYAYSAQGLGRKETPLYNSKAKKQLSKIDKEFGG
ncbi:hypothetical protein HanXRQr2_Chr14g0635031 [Helianthus annuus]|uniref:Uncharacterized protein n=1 Tax=Helianthus annuus TaxID=4232 RepID=A0A9K3E7N4_HELAN|nr:hypothetical protein HanXRQr2_Chr14g0635031 [Helianthus annuus]KAJ0655637.1 hypothetical protein HanLR1_Chr14g0526551 [Helianthus annuus]KAJ0659325.1 hypothetical protein HanOQP8_Chr14g0524801 [Helianthus annuus]KAJ0839618.1 hypothetical protein HanPSC8_Chr14g0608991 [Helianthus annuus]